MLGRFEMASTPWRRGPFRIRTQQIRFGQTYEDSEIELRAFRPRSRVFSIAGAGHTACVLAAAGHLVTAVDINLRQLAYAQSRAEGEPRRTGTAERVLGLGRAFAAIAGWSRGKLEAFLNLSDCARQVEYWDRWLDTRLWRAAVDLLLSPRLLSLFYASPFVASLPREFGRQIRQRLRRCWASYPNRSNPYAASLLLGAPLPAPGPPAVPMRFVCADAADFLESSRPSAFDAFALSNIGDGASPEYLRRLRRALEHAAAPDAVVVSRTFAEPASDTATNCAALDRSMLWGVVDVRPAATFGDGGMPCSTC
jgi:S-adenosylmethionine:diacylglycerol 3-amino-3-carboxypropyl transferase